MAVWWTDGKTTLHPVKEKILLIRSSKLFCCNSLNLRGQFSFKKSLKRWLALQLDKQLHAIYRDNVKPFKNKHLMSVYFGGGIFYCCFVLGFFYFCNCLLFPAPSQRLERFIPSSAGFVIFHLADPDHHTPRLATATGPHASSPLSVIPIGRGTDGPAKWFLN